MWKYACKCCIFHLINYSKNVGTLCLEFAFLHFFSWSMCKKIVSINAKTIFFWMIVLYTHTPIKHHNNTPFMENQNPKCDKNKYKNAKFSNFKMKMRQKIKIFPCKLYPFNIHVYFKHRNTSCTLLKNVYIIQVW